MTTVRPQPLAEGRFQLLEIIGEGGMATVYRAYDQRLQRPRAIKILSPAFSQRPALRRRFLSEAQTMANLEEARVVRVFDMGEDGDRVFIVMELVEGGSLVDRVKMHGPLPPQMAAKVVVDLCESLHGAHENNIIHRDIKPHNVLLTRSGELRITDFGIAQVQHEDHAGMTRTGAVLGTWGFMAPEQKSNAKQVDARADIYSVGATLWSLLKNDTPPELFMSDSEPEWFAEIPDPLAEVIRRACRYRREERYPSARAMAEALRTILPLIPDDPDDTPPLVPRMPDRPSNSDSTDTYAQLVGEGASRVGSELPARTPAEGTMVPEPMPGGTLAYGGEAPSEPEPELPPAESAEDRLLRRRVPILAGLLGLAVAAAVVWFLSPGVKPKPVVEIPDHAKVGEPGPVGEVAPAPVEVAPPVVPEPAVDPAAAQLAAAPEPKAPPTATSGRTPAGTSSSPKTPTTPVAASSEVPPAGAQPTVAITPIESTSAPAAPTAKTPAGKLAVSAPESVTLGESVRFSASIGGKYSVKLYYRGRGAGAFREKPMHGSGGSYSATVTIDDSMSGGLDYFVSATDVSGNQVREGSAMAPRKVAVQI